MYPQGKVQDVRGSDFYFFEAEEPEKAVAEVIRLGEGCHPQELRLSSA